MSYLGNFNDTLAIAAQHFISLGWSIIPLQGDMDSSRSKSPALPRWKQYQRTQVDQFTRETWFGSVDAPQQSSPQHAIGVVLGRVSGLVVIDIDDPHIADAFELACPDLTETLTIRSGNRQLPHYYFHIPTDLHIAGRTVPGCELRSDGQYVVAPGSVIDGRAWEVVNDVEPKILTERDLRRVLRFMQSSTHKSQENSLNRVSEPKRAYSESVEPTLSDQQPLNAEVIVAYYRSLAPKIGRNNALFRAARFARDMGWSQQKVTEVLQSIHAHQPSAQNTHFESIRSRLTEATRTIVSVFSRIGHRVKVSTNVIPNAIREKLLQHDFVNVARVLDGLQLAGFKAGMQITINDAYAALKAFGIGRQALQMALNSVVPPPSPPPVADAANRPDGQIKQCLFDRVAKPTKNRGRPAAVYVVPSTQQLITRLGIDPDQVKGGDTLTPEDLKSPASYRAALHKSLLERSPGIYPRKWLAQRLGVSEDSCRRYEKQSGVMVQANYTTWPITWANAEAVLPEKPDFGEFLEDEQGRRYPPKVTVARMLITAGHQVTFKVQGANHYSVPFTCQDAAQALPSVHELPVDVVSVAPVPWSKQAKQANAVCEQIAQPSYSSTDANVECCGPQQFSEQVATQSNVVDRNISPQSVTSVPSSVKQQCVDRLYTQLKAMNASTGLARNRAMELVETYGVRLINKGLWLLQKRTGIRNPTGFLLSWLRSEAVAKRQEMLRPTT